MSARGRRIVLLADEGPVAEAIAAALSERGHSIAHVRDGRELLATADGDVLVVDLGRRDARGLDPVEDLARAGRRPRLVVLSASHDLDTCRRALRLGAREFLPKPFPIDEFLRAIEEPGETAREGVGRWRRSLRASPAAIERSAREVCAFAVRCGMGPTARARLATACAELVENAVRHAYAADQTSFPGVVHLELVVEPRRAVLSVRDEGRGFDATTLGLGHMSDSRDGGLARVSSLCEDLRLESGERGTCATATFDVFRVLFDDDAGVDLSEHDWLTPETTRGLLAALEATRLDEGMHLSPALAVTVGRLLAGPDPRRVLQTALWS